MRTIAPGRIAMEPVSSSNVAAIGFDPGRSILQVEFVHGGTYQYFDVSWWEFQAFRRATSKGQYLHRQIKPRRRYAKVAG